MRLLWIQAGFSMVQGMVISAVIAGSALVATRMMTTQKMALNSAESKDQIAELHKQIYAVLQNREHCLRTFSTPLATVAINSSTPHYQVTQVKGHLQSGGTGDQVFVKNDGTAAGVTYMNGKVRINSMYLKTGPNLSDPQDFVINYVRYESTNMNVRSGKGFGGQSINRIIKVRLQRATAASTTINGCYAVEADADSDTGAGNSDLNKDFCERLGTGAGEAASLYTWDETRNTCTLKNNVCADKTVFEGIDSTGLAICRPFADYVPYFLDTAKPCPTTKVGVRLRYDAGSKKVSIECY